MPMPDFSSGLDLRRNSGSLGLTPQGQPDSGLTQEADPQAAQQFQEAMASGHAGTPLPGAGVPPPQDLPSGPFALFGATTTPKPPAHEARVLAELSTMVSRLMVADGRQSQRGLRLELSEDVMPGVSLALFEESGAMVAEFECRVESSFVKLSAPAQTLANQLAVTLRRDTVWRVLAEPSAGIPSPQPVEAFGYDSASME